MRFVLVAATVLLLGCALDLSGSAWKKSGAMVQQVTAALLRRLSRQRAHKQQNGCDGN